MAIKPKNASRTGPATSKATGTGNATATTTSHSSSNVLPPQQSVVDKLSLLRSFVSDTNRFTETDLSTCLRQAGYQIELAAERLMTGQYQPQPHVQSHSQSQSAHKKRKVSSSSSSSSSLGVGRGRGDGVTIRAPSSVSLSSSLSSTPPQRPLTTTSTATIIANTNMDTPPIVSLADTKRPSPTNSTTTTTNTTTTTRIRKPTPVTPKTPSSPLATPIFSTTMRTSSPSNANSSGTMNGNNNDTNNDTNNGNEQQLWLLCHRWLSDGINLHRRGAMAYQEWWEVEATAGGGGGVGGVRFRGRHLQGQFPKSVGAFLGPLLHATPPLIHVKAQALMEERDLPTGAQVAFAVWVSLPNPARLFALFDDDNNDNQTNASSSAKHFFGTKASSASSSSSSSKKPLRLKDAAFRLLQWAQHGEPHDFTLQITEGNGETTTSPTNNSITTTASSEEENDEELVDDEEVVETGADDIPDWAQSVVTATTPTSATLPEGKVPKEAHFPVQLRPYQRQALWWMTQREAQDELEESSRQQLELLQELMNHRSSSSASSSSSNTTGQHPTTVSRDTPIHCDCGPVQVHTPSTPAPAAVLDHDGRDPNLTHPLWERRYLTNASRTQARSFYVQPIFGAATAKPPPPPQPCRGGILADSMGLGKTVMLLALIVSSKSNRRSERGTSRGTSGTTLIVAPLSLLAQWQEELESKTKLSHQVYYGDKKQGWQDFDAVDVVLTTYGTLQGEWMTRYSSKAAAKRKTNNHHPSPRSSATGLLGHSWNRVILDEAHCIKNPSTVASRACRMLQAERRWCVSGTIIQNSLEDVLSLLQFLRHEPWCQPSFWKAAISHAEEPQALDRVRRLLTPIMLRRTKESLDAHGNPILTLPPVETKIISVDFSPAERQFYDALLQRSLSLFEGFLRAGTASKSWLAIFSLLHRLRQTCDHVALTLKAHMDQEEWTTQIASSTSPQKASQRTTRRSSTFSTPRKENQQGGEAAIDQAFLDGLMSQFRSMQSMPGNSTNTKEQGDAPYVIKIGQMLNEAVQNKSSLLKEECPYCLDPIQVCESVVTPCFHIFCKECLVEVLRSQPQEAGHPPTTANRKEAKQAALPSGPCPVCNEGIDASKILRLSESNGQIQTSYLLDSMSALRSAAEPITTTSSSVAAVVKAESDAAARQVLETAVQGSTGSSKLSAILKELDNVWEEDPGSKVLIFSQFLGFLDLMEGSFKTTEIPFARLDGKLSLKERMVVLQDFGCDSKASSKTRTKKGVGSVLLISMKAGGVGLNLVAARTVFIADPWWNAAVEDQCVDRIHRIGQTAEKVRVRKFYVSNSVEERIVELQKRKKNVANEVLCDNRSTTGAPSDSSGSRPTLEDFKILFRDDGSKRSNTF